MAVKKRCRTIGGVVYDLTATDREPPCRRAAPKPSPKSVRPPPPKSVRPPQNQGRKPGTIVVNDLRVLERQERDRAFEASRPKRGALAAVGKLPPKPKPAAVPDAPRLSATEKAVLRNVRKSNDAGLLYHADAFKPSTLRVLKELAARGVVVEREINKFHMPGFSAADLAANARRGAFAPPWKKPTPRDLPPNFPPSSARVGDIVSVVGEGETIATLGTSVFSYGTIEALPGPGKYGRVSTEPSVLFESGPLAGMTRYVRWERIYPGRVSNDVVWKKWKIK